MPGKEPFNSDHAVMVPILVHFDGRVKSQTSARAGKIGFDQPLPPRLSSYCPSLSLIPLLMLRALRFDMTAMALNLTALGIL
jgi:hypothetical protein